MNVGGGGSDSQDFDLNIASLIDCFTVLITFMLASASFLSIGILDAGVAASAAQAKTDTPPPPINIAVELKADKSIAIKVSGKENQTQNIVSKQQEEDLDALTADLTQIKQRWPTSEAVTLTAENAVPYKDVVKSMEVIRAVLPAVLLGGF